MVYIPKYLELDWEKYIGYVHLLTRKISMTNYRDWPILAIARGGLIPGVMISHILKNPNFQVIGISSYNDREQGPIRITQKPNIPSRCLIVDDLIDSGKTMEVVKGYLKYHHKNCEFKVTVLIDKFDMTKENPRSDLFVVDIHPDTWIKFPYER